MNAFRRVPAWAYLSALLGVLLLCAAGVVISNRLSTEYWHQQTDTESLIARSATSTDHVIGTLSAPVQLIVYEDLSCVYCQSFFTSTLPRLRSRYADSIVVVFRNLPLPSHPNSRLEAQAAECVNTIGGPDAFWGFVRAVFATPGYEQGLSLDELASIASPLGVSGTKLRACVSSGSVDARIDRDALEATVAGIHMTPSIVLKSATRALIVHGDYYGQLQAGIEYLLQSTSTTRRY